MNISYDDFVKRIKRAVLILRTDEGDNNPEYDRALLELYNMLAGDELESLSELTKDYA